MSNKNDHDIYIIPPNFIESGTFFGGMFRARNVIEAGILAFALSLIHICICIAGAILNGLGFIMAYVTPLFAGGQWAG